MRILRVRSPPAVPKWLYGIMAIMTDCLSVDRGSISRRVANKRNNRSLVAETIGEIILEIGSHYPNVVSISLFKYDSIF